MNTGIVGTALRNLERVEHLLQSLDDAVYSNSGIGPYYSSIGEHLRHVLDIFSCIARGVDSGLVDLTDRRRGLAAQQDRLEALVYLNAVVAGLYTLRGMDLSTPIEVVDDLGDGRTQIQSTLGAGLSQAHSHAIHHFACIGYILHSQGVELPDPRFGYNPTTPSAAVSDLVQRG